MAEKIGVVVSFKLFQGGGAPRVVVDLINALNSMGKEVYLLSPWKLDYKKINELYGSLKIEKLITPKSFKRFFCLTGALSRRIIKKEFIFLCNKVDKIIDVDGGIVHNFLPKNFSDENYVIWRISCVIPESERPWIKRPLKLRFKEFLKKILGSKKSVPSKNHKIYAIDEWTKKELRYLNLECQKMCLYPEIKVNDFLNTKSKKKQISIFGRLAPNKNIENSLTIFAKGTEKYKNYSLKIFGGETSETNSYILELKKIMDYFKINERVEIIKNPSFEKLKELLSETEILIDSQREISLTMTSIEALSAGAIILAYQNSGTYLDVLKNGKYGYGFKSIDDGSAKLEYILKNLKNIRKKQDKNIKRVFFFSKDNFIKRLKKVLNE